MPALSDQDLAFFDQHGYLVVRQAVERVRREAVAAAIWDFLGMDRNDPQDWYRPPHRTNGMVEMYHHPSMWDVRQDPLLYEAFSQILGRPDLWVSLDRANMKPPPHPAHADYAHPGMVHWDIDIRQRPLQLQVQGVLYLSDTPAGAGGFQCVPGFQRRAEQWVSGRPEEEILRSQDVRELDASEFENVIPIEGEAGDFIIWHSALPHGNSPNDSNQPRLALYITMYPQRSAEPELAANRIASWNDRSCPSFQGRAFPGDERAWEPAHYEAPVLSELGKRLLGVDPWSVAR